MFNWFNRVAEDYDVEDIGDGLLDRIADLEARVLKIGREHV